MEKVSRRTFLQFTGAAGVWTLFGCNPYPGSAVVSPVPWGWHRGEERWVPSTCLQCPGRCGIRVRVFEGRAVKIEGNPEHPLNRGGLCPKGQAGLQVLYDPDRIPGPMRKIGGRSSMEWQSISWEEALDTVARRLVDLRASERSQSLLLLGGRFPGHMRDLFARFARAYGTANFVDSSSIYNRPRRIATYLCQGVDDLPCYDLERTRYLMLFGAGFLESWQSTTYTLRMYGAMRRGRPGQRAKIVVVDPRFGVGASKADEWLPIRPGTDAALALGMAHVIIAEELYDREFIEQHTFGFEDWREGDDFFAADGPSVGGLEHEGFRTMVSRDYSPDQVSAITGIPAPQVERLAREFALAQPAIAAAGRGPGLHTNGLFANMAIHSLNAMVGNLGVPGGVRFQAAPPFRAWPEPAIDDLARGAGDQPPLAWPVTSAPSAGGGVPGGAEHGVLLDSILGGEQRTVDAAFVYYTNPLFSGPDTSRYQQAIDRIPFLVSFSPFMDDTTARADLVLPDGTYLERLEDDFVLPTVGGPVLSLRQPVVEPVHDTRHTGDVLIELARRIGGTVAASFPWKNYEAALKEVVAGVVTGGTGSFTANGVEEFWSRLKERGVWYEDAGAIEDRDRMLRTPSGRFEFFSTTWRAHVRRLAAAAGCNVDTVLDELGVQARGDTAFMPHYEEERRLPDPGGEYPLNLHSYKTMMHAEGRGGNQPWLQESYGVQLGERWEPWLEINPATAEALGIHDEEEVWVESERGRIRLRARLHPGTWPDVVNVPFEYGHASYGRWAEGIDGNPNSLTPSLVDRTTGVHAFHATRVRVYHA